MRLAASWWDRPRSATCKVMTQATDKSSSVTCLGALSRSNLPHGSGGAARAPPSIARAASRVEGRCRSKALDPARLRRGQKA